MVWATDYQVTVPGVIPAGGTADTEKEVSSSSNSELSNVSSRQEACQNIALHALPTAKTSGFDHFCFGVYSTHFPQSLLS